MRLSQTVIDRGNIDTRGKADFIAWDDDLPGFGLRIREGGSRNYIIQYKVGSQNRRKTFGSTKELKLEQARKLAKKDLGRVASGEDPQAEKAAARATATETFKAVTERFLAFQAKRLRASSLYCTRLYLITHCKRLHALKVEAVTRREIASILQTIAGKSGAVSADRARAALSAMFAWAMKEGLVEANPTIATNTYAGKTERDRVLSKGEIAAIWMALPDNDYGRIVKLLFLTGCRSDEIGGLRWYEIQIDDRRLSFPQERMKNKRAFQLPLSDAAFWLLMSVPQRVEPAYRDFVFGRRADGFQGWSKAKRELDTDDGLRGMAAWQLRDIRRTAATGMAELGVQPHIVEACLNHVSGSKAGVAGIYNRATYAPEKREAFDVWANHLAVIVAQASGANVTPLHNRSGLLEPSGKSA